MSPEAYVVTEYHLKDGPAEGPIVTLDAHATQILGVFGSAAEAIAWVLKTFEETAGARRQLSDAEKVALFSVLVAADPFIEHAYTPIVIPVLPGKVVQILAGRMLGSLVQRLEQKAAG